MEGSQIKKASLGEIINIAEGVIMLKGHAKLCNDQNDHVYNTLKS